MQPVIYPKKPEDPKNAGLECANCYQKKYALWRCIMDSGAWDLVCPKCLQKLTGKEAK